MLRLALVSCTVMCAACGGSSDDPSVDAPVAADAAILIDGAPIDGAPIDGGVDAPAGTMATVVDCAGVTPVAEIRYVGDVLTPRTTTVTVGAVVRFSQLGSHTAWETNGLWSATGDQETCVRFDGAGAYSFYCYFDMADPDEVGTVTAE
jgi:plastocyanin